MKRNIYKILIIALVVGACKPKLEGELGVPFDKIAALAGTWQLEQFIQKDPNNPIQEERDLTQFYVVNDIAPTTLQINGDATYTVAEGPGKNPFGTSGTWGFDNIEFPIFLILNTPTDTLNIALNSVVRSTDTSLSLSVDKVCTDDTGVDQLVSIYIFKFKRI